MLSDRLFARLLPCVIQASSGSKHHFSPLGCDRGNNMLSLSHLALTSYTSLSVTHCSLLLFYLSLFNACWNPKAFKAVHMKQTAKKVSIKRKIYQKASITKWSKENSLLVIFGTFKKIENTWMYSRKVIKQTLSLSVILEIIWSKCWNSDFGCRTISYKKYFLKECMSLATFSVKVFD